MGAQFPEDWFSYPKILTGNWSRYKNLVSQVQTQWNLFIAKCENYPPLLTLSTTEGTLPPHEEALENFDKFVDMVQTPGNSSRLGKRAAGLATLAISAAPVVSKFFFLKF